MSMKSHRFKVTPDFNGTRLDQFIALQGVELSKRKIKEVIDAGGVYINRKRARIASRPVNGGDTVEMQYSLETLKRIKQREHEIGAPDILYDHYDIIAVNKPPGLPTQATRDQSLVHLEAAVKKFLVSRGERNPRLFLVHRLDKETSGIVLLAKTPEAVTFLTNQFRDRTVTKEYIAICSGIPREKKFVVECFLSPIDKRTGNVSVVRSGGKPSLTRFELIASDNDLKISMIRCYPETGRSHQIRVHLAHKGFPILGDKRYNQSRTRLPGELENLVAVHHLLHARRLTFCPAAGVPEVTLEAQPPGAFSSLIPFAGA